ncbi:hypothetical protein [Klebsiella oxytoca]|uniref:hypothetical protein n=1 Tax=Klebsiella oxytoca TaxID=571 RepID=UPI00190EAE33|nr:hypothetical protein [Klebsiella oxytoca]
MNIETVNELIQSLESAGELSIKETKVMALAKAYLDVAAENVALKNAIECHKAGFTICEACGEENGSWNDDVCKALDDTPATDRIVAEAEARGVEKAIAHLDKKFSNIGVQIMNLQWLADSLREGADK